MNRPHLFIFALLGIACLMFVSHPNVTLAKKKKELEKIKVLIVDGQSKYHPHWKEWTPILIKQLDDSGLFSIDVATSPMKGESLDSFNPKFKNYDVIVTTYDGDTWSGRARRTLENYLAGGGGMVVVHAADNAFPEWEAYNLMIGLGGWGNRAEASGPYVYIDDRGEKKLDTSSGEAGHHGPRHEFIITTRAPEHPIMKGLPTAWLHTEDELYDHLRGPAKNMEILATAFSSEKYEGTNRNEPILMAIHYEQGRVFHTTLGHMKKSLSCIGFMTTFVRGCEWAATGKVSFEVPADFPTATKSSHKSY